MNIHHLDNKNTGLLFFDMLNVYFHAVPQEKQKALKPVVENAARLMNSARAAKIPIFYAMANHRPDGDIRYQSITDTDMRLRPWPGDDCKPTVHGATEGAWEQKVIDELRPQSEDYIIPKYRWSTFHQTYFDLALRNKGIDTIIISGGAVDVGVASTAYAARDLDYNLIIVRDACSNSYEESMKVFMDTVFPRMARVRTTDQTIEMIGRG